MLVGAATVIVPLAFAALYLLVARADGSAVPRSPGSVAYGVTVGVIGMVVYGVLMFFIVLSAPGSVVLGGAPPGLVVLGLLSLIMSLSGVLLFLVARRRLCQV